MLFFCFFDSRRVMFFVYCTCVYNARLAYFGASEISQSPLLPLFALDVQRVGGGGGERRKEEERTRCVTRLRNGCEGG